MLRATLLLLTAAPLLSSPLPYDGVVRAAADGSSIAYMAPPNIANHASTLEQLPNGDLLLACASSIFCAASPHCSSQLTQHPFFLPAIAQGLAACVVFLPGSLNFQALPSRDLYLRAPPPPLRPQLKEEADKCAIAVSRLPAGSSQWSPPRIVSERDGFSNQNPVLFHDTSTGVTWLFHSQLAAGAGEGLDTLWALQSADGGLTWSQPSTFLDFTAQGRGVFDRNRIVPRADGSLLFPLYWTTDKVPNAPFMLFSAAGNHSAWGAPVDVAGAANLVQPTVVRTAPGTLKAFFRDREAKNVFGAASSDEGLTWSAPSAEAAGGLPNNNAGIEAFQLASGSTVLLFNNCTKGRTPLTAALSATGGASWARGRNLQLHDDNSTNTEGVEYSYPTVLQTPVSAQTRARAFALPQCPAPSISSPTTPRAACRRMAPSTRRTLTTARR